MPLKRIRTPTKIRPAIIGVRRRIIIPQPGYRPLRIRTRDVTRRPEMRLDPWWFVRHRRGVRRTQVGIDPLEARAIPRERLAGTLPERIVYAYLTERLGFRHGVDFDFQSSVAGGRLELGGIVADFLFPLMRIIINPLGPTHDTFERQIKNEEQISELMARGFEVFMIPDDDVYNEYTFEEIMRRIFALPGGRMGSSPAYGAYEANPLWYERLFYMAQQIYQDLQRQMDA